MTYVGKGKLKEVMAMTFIHCVSMKWYSKCADTIKVIGSRKSNDIRYNVKEKRNKRTNMYV